MPLVSKNVVMNACKEQVEDQLTGDEGFIDQVLIFDGPISVALEQQFAGQLESGAEAFVFIAFSGSVPFTRAGDGTALIQEQIIDFYAVVKGKGATRYTNDRERLNDISDSLFDSVFIPGNWTAAFVANIASFEPDSVTRQDLGDDALISHLVRFHCRPKRV